MVTFHAGHVPEMELQVLQHYPHKVASWDGPEDDRVPHRMALYRAGACQRCSRNVAEVEQDECLCGIATFGEANVMDLLYGYPTNSDSLGPFGSELLRELHYCFANATIVEEMLLALLHMQVDVCFLRRRKSGAPTGLTCFRKNIIAFPQGLSEVKQLFHFLTSLQIGDLVNVEAPEGDSNADRLRGARVTGFTEDGFTVGCGFGNNIANVTFAQVRQRIVLPWGPCDLSSGLIILRRRGTGANYFVEDLRVRRNMLRRILALVSRRCELRTDMGTEPLHMYYLHCEQRSDTDMLFFLRRRGSSITGFPRRRRTSRGHKCYQRHFPIMVWEGRFHCDCASALLHLWANHLQGSSNETLAGFYHYLVHADAHPSDGAGDSGSELELLQLAKFMCEHASLPRLCREQRELKKKQLSHMRSCMEL